MARISRRGSNAMEFALIMPIFIGMLTGLCDFAWQAAHQTALESAAHFGCRQGSLIDPGMQEADMAAIQSTTEKAMVTWLEDRGTSCGDVGCVTSVSAVGSNPARSLSCQVGLHFEPLVGLVSSQTQLTAEAIVRLEYQRSL